MQSSLSKRITFGVSSSIISRIIIIVLNLTFIPILFRSLGKEELGIWFMLGQSGSLIGLLDLGLSPTITRWIALAKGKSGAELDSRLSNESHSEIADLVASGVLLYRYLSIGVFIISLVLGIFFLNKLNLQTVSTRDISIAWTILCLSHAVGVWAGIWSCVLNGMGIVGWDVILQTLMSILTIICQIIAIMMGGGLISLACVATMGGIISRYGIRYFVKHHQPAIFNSPGKWNKSLILRMLKPALKCWLTTLGGFMILKTDQYFIAYIKGSEKIPSFFAAYQIVMNLSSIAGSFAAGSSVFISQLWQAKEKAKIHQIVKNNLRLGLIIMLCGDAFLCVSGKDLIELWLGKGNFVGYPVLLIFCITQTLEMHHFILSYSSRATEDEVFVYWAIGSGILNLIFTWLLIKPLGLFGVALGTFLAQILTNNWYASYRGLKRLEINSTQYVKSISPPLLVFVFTLVISYSIKSCIGTNMSTLFTLLTILIIIIIIALTSIYYIVYRSNIEKTP